MTAMLQPDGMFSGFTYRAGSAVCEMLLPCYKLQQFLVFYNEQDM